MCNVECACVQGEGLKGVEASQMQHLTTDLTLKRTYYPPPPNASLLWVLGAIKRMNSIRGKDEE